MGANKEGPKELKIRYMFTRVGDQDGSGAVSMHEYHTVMMNLGFGPDLAKKYMTEDFGKYDADGDEMLNYEEFKAHMANPKSDEKQMPWAALGADEFAGIEMVKIHTAKWDANGDG